MKKILLFTIILIAASCTIEVNQPGYTENFYLDDITVFEIDDNYIDLTILEGDKDVYAKVYIGNTLVATTDVEQGAKLPVTLDAPHFPLEIYPEDIGNHLSIDLYDRDPNEDDYLGSLSWRIEGFHGDVNSVFLYDGDNEIELYLFAN